MQICDCGTDTQIPFSRGDQNGPLSNRVSTYTRDTAGVPAKSYLIPSDGFSRVYECDRLTDHATVQYRSQ